jgi:hypothetical protein
LSSRGIFRVFYRGDLSSYKEVNLYVAMTETSIIN